MRDHPPASWTFPAHLHRRESETIYVVDGEFDVQVGDERRSFARGDCVHIPAGVVHSAINTGGDAQRLILFVPDGMDELFARIGALLPAEPVDLDFAAAEAQRHGWRFVPA